MRDGQVDLAGDGEQLLDAVRVRQDLVHGSLGNMMYRMEGAADKLRRISLWARCVLVGIIHRQRAQNVKVTQATSAMRRHLILET